MIATDESKFQAFDSHPKKHTLYPKIKKSLYNQWQLKSH